MVNLVGKKKYILRKCELIERKKIEDGRGAL